MTAEISQLNYRVIFGKKNKKQKKPLVLSGNIFIFIFPEPVILYISAVAFKNDYNYFWHHSF